MNPGMALSTILGALAIVASVTSLSTADIGPGSLEGAIREADFIGVINILELEPETPTTKIARGAILEVWKGEPLDHVRIDVKRLLGDDISTAIPGETVVAILTKIHDEDYYRFGPFGFGRLPVRTAENVRYVHIYLLSVAAELPTVSLDGTESTKPVYKVHDLKEYVRHVVQKTKS